MAIKVSGTTVIDDSRNIQNVGIISATSINATNISITGGGAILGIQSGGVLVGSGATTLNFIGTGNTFAYNAGTKTLDISIRTGVDISRDGSDIEGYINKLNFTGVGISTISKNGTTANIEISFDQISQLPSLPE